MLDDVALERSSVVANNAMNRERGLTGPNSYTKDLGTDLVALLDGARWLDLCCGSGRALEDARALFGDRVRTVGLDLVDHFAVEGPEFVVGSLATWRPEGAFDLITCVHGLHYVGDKLGAISRAASWLAPGGRFTANLDVADVRDEDGAPLGRKLTGALRAAGFTYDTRRRVVSCVGGRSPVLPFDYLGADDRAGPNYTGQPAVVSFYRPTP
ncbi:MAG TPA: class I SAM-dependent methyltransferase [Umezawaea sp.]|nr:class I SAM-dependent methyltransferase [Umezawaea sp.]